MWPQTMSSAILDIGQPRWWCMIKWIRTRSQRLRERSTRKNQYSPTGCERFLEIPGKVAQAFRPVHDPPPVTIYRWGRTCILQPAGNQNNGCEVSYACHRAKATCLQCQPTREYTFSLAASCRQLDSRLRGQGSLEPGRTANTPRSLSLLKLNMIYMPANILSDVCWPLSKLMLAYFYI